MTASATDSTSEATPAGVSLSRLWSVLRPHRWPVLIATILMLLATAAGLAVPWLAGRVVDVALEETSIAELRRVVVGLIALFAVMGVLGATETYLLGSAGAHLMRSLRSRVFDHFISLSPAFFAERRVGELLSRLSSDLLALRSALTQQVPSGVQALLRFLGTLILLLWLQTRLTVVALLVVPPVVVLAMVVGRRLERLSTQQTDAAAGASGFAEESLSGIRTVQSYGFEAGVRTRYASKLDLLLHKQLRSTALHAIFVGALSFAGFSAFAIVLGYGGQLMMQGVMTPGQLTAFLLYTFGVATSVGQLGSLYAAYRELRGASVRVFGLLDQVSTVVEAEAPVSLGQIASVELSGVTFTYPGGAAPALSGIDLRVEAGEVLGLVGPSGGGKSTLFSLIQRFYDPQEGSVRIGGQDLLEVALDDLRSRIAVVPQDIFLFSGSVEFNLRVARPEATSEQIREAARAAGADDFVLALVQGYDTEVGERGVKLSAGQRQRLAIARAFLADRPILLLDEATSALDPDSEEHVRRALERLLDGRTTLLIAHRLATARRADRLIVLEGGSIAAEGDHTSLLASSELYRRYWELQSLQHEVLPHESDV